MTAPDERRGSDDGQAGGSDDAVGAPTCPRCGARLEHRHCEYVCPNHGVVYDCGDTFWLR